MGMNMAVIEQAMMQAIENQEDSIMSQVNKMDNASSSTAAQDQQGAAPPSGTSAASGTSGTSGTGSSTQSATTNSQDMLNLQFSMQQWSMMANMASNIQKEMKDGLSDAINNMH